MLAGGAGAGIAAEAELISLGSPVVGNLAPLAANYYEVSSVNGGRLTVSLTDSPGLSARVSLIDSTGAPLVQSDGSASGASLIDVNVPAGNDFLEVESLAGAGTYQITASLIPATPAFAAIGAQFSGYPALAAGDFLGNGIDDLVAPDGIHLGVGDGTFQSSVIDGPLGQSGWTVTAIAVGDFNDDGLPDIAFAETNPDGTAADLRVLENEGGGEFQLVAVFAVDSDPVAIQTIDFARGVVDLAVADAATGHVAIFVGNGAGGFSVGPVLDGGDTPSAMVSGQFGDGHVDLIVADQGDPSSGAGEGLSVFQDDGPGQFQFAGTIAVGSGPSAVTAGDFTGNGVLDLAVADENSNDVSVLLNNGNGTFAPPETFAVGELPVAIVAVDLGNGRVDLVTANGNSDDISVLIGNGDGTFQPQMRFAVGSFPAALVTADFNGDGRPDLAVANLEGSGDISVLLGRGDGTFQDTTINPVGDDPVGVVTADLNHDGYVDLITANSYSNDVSVLLGNGDGSFQAAGSFAAGVDPTGLVAGDFNGDGRMDVAVADGGDGDSAQEGVSILLGNGDGTFQSPVFYAIGGYPSSIVEGDFLGSGVLDLAVTIPGSDDVVILVGNGLGGFPTQLTIPLANQGGIPIALVAGDFTGSGALDIAVLNQVTDDVTILEGDGSGHFTQFLPALPLNLPLDEPEALAAGDFTGNGKLDLAVVSAGYQTPDFLSIFLNQGQGLFDPLQPIALGTGLYPSAVVAAPFFGGATLGLAVLDQATGAVSLLQGSGTGEFSVASIVNLGSNAYVTAVAVGDFTGDGDDDLAIATQSPNGVTVELNQGQGQFVAPSAVGLAPQNTPVVADFTGDGVPDVAVVDGEGDILFRQGVADEPGSFDPPITINPGRPSRDITAVITRWGMTLASVDATNNAVSLFAYIDGQFRLVDTLATGPEPAQVVAADLYGMGDDDLIIRNAGDGSLTIYAGNPLVGAYQPALTLAVGMGVSDVSVADLNPGGLPDILLANQTSGEVEVIMNLGGGEFSSPTLYRAGQGLSAVVANAGDSALSIVSQDGTIGVAAAIPAPGLPPEIMALDAGANTLGILAGLGDGLFANPYSLPTTGTTIAIRVGDLTGNGIDDLAVLGPDGVTIWLGDGRGGFVQGATYNVGPDPTGLTIADLNGDKVPDLVVGNAFGDVLVLLGEGQGLFRPPVITDQRVALAVTYPDGPGSPTFVLSDQANDSVVVESPSQTPAVVANRTTGLLVPGAPELADLNGDGIPDLIVLNTGGNDVLVYPGLPGGGFGPALNDGIGFPTGTNPVAVIVANLNGRSDLIVANQGSNDVSILLNVPQGNSFTFVPGPRLSVGVGPVGLLYGDFFGNGTDDLVVSDSGSDDLMVLPSLGNGFFDDTNPVVIPLAESPGSIFAGSFGAGPGLDIVALDPNTSDVTLISGLPTGSPTSQVFSSGGVDPVAAIAVNGFNGFDDLVVANNANGRVALLAGGPNGLSVDQVNSSLDQLYPTGLAFGSLQNNSLEVYASTAGQEAATLLSFSLGGLGGSSGILSGQGFTLLPLSDQSLPLIATLLTPLVNLNESEEQPGGSPEGEAVAVVLATATTALGQGPFVRNLGVGSDEDADFLLELDDAAQGESEKAGISLWRLVEIGLEEAFEEFRRASQRQPSSGTGPQGSENDAKPDPPSASPSPSAEPLSDRCARNRDGLAIVDAALSALESAYPDSLAFPTIGRKQTPALITTTLDRHPWTKAGLIVLEAGLMAAPLQRPLLASSSGRAPRRGERGKQAWPS